MEIDWLKSLASSWAQQLDEGRLPHAVLLQGSRGVGKRSAAAWMARRYLAQPAGELPVFPLQVPEHPDLRWIAIPEDRKSIGIDQIRELVADIHLTSHAGAGKAAVVEPADAMTVSAANSLLKTLEEPPGDALLILIADRTVNLPATILSRCRRISVPLPSEAASIAWLNRLRPADNWSAALAVAGQAPIAAVMLQDRLGEVDEMARDFAALGERRAAPLEIAARWASREPEFVFGWLAQEVQTVVYTLCAGRARKVAGGTAESVLKRIDRRNLFCYLDIINRLRAQTPGSFNVQLALESLLIDWAEGLENCADRVIATPLGLR
ncbi:MAG: hypothetical protein KJO31_19510 [Gammaproteobacteria bacterium]|nr:hypothetical protein [Gammaproteobacteria bacterium]